MGRFFVPDYIDLFIEKLSGNDTAVNLYRQQKEFR